MKIVQIDLGSVKYPVYISSSTRSKIPELLAELNLKGHLYFLIDEFIYNNYDVFRDVISSTGANYYIVKGKKNNKTFYSAMKVFADLDEKNLARDTTIVAVGGGVIGDLGGFIASCWYRGTKLVHIPTTLLSAVDSCLGGKTAINFKNTVNAVGTYYHPLAILIDTTILAGLPAREISSGFGEVIKYAALGCDPIKRRLASEENLSPEALGWYVMHSLKEKEKYVSNDVYEGSKRLFLNYGHTIGHAIEFSTIYEGEESLRHGEGVALGMLAVLRIGIELKYSSESEIDWLRAILSRFNLPISFDAASIGIETEDLRSKVVSLAFKDKKRTKDALRFVVLKSLGNPSLYTTADKQLIRKGVSEVIV